MEPSIDTRQLRAFLILAREGSFTKAGEALSLTQSAISHAIRALESDLGCRLFHREGKRVLPTPHGRELQGYAEEIEAQMAQARAALGALDQSPRGRLRLGAPPTVIEHLLPAVMREFRESFPDFQLLIEPADSADVASRLETGQLDIGLCLKPRDSRLLRCHPLFSDELRFLVAPGHPWAATPPKARDLAGKAFFLPSPDSVTFESITDYFRNLSQRPASLSETGSAGAAHALARLGLGIAVGTTWAAQPELAGGHLKAVPLPKARMRREWIVAQLKDRPPSLAERTFLGLCTEIGRMIAPTA